MTIPEVRGQDYGRMAAACVALATDDRKGLDLVLADAQASGRSLEFLCCPLSIVGRLFDLHDGGPDAVEKFQRKIAELIAQADGDQT